MTIVEFVHGVTVSLNSAAATAPDFAGVLAEAYTADATPGPTALPRVISLPKDGRGFRVPGTVQVTLEPLQQTG